MDYTNKKVIVRTNRAGVFFGTLKEYDHVNREATIENCRQIYYWSGAATLLQMAQEGVKYPGDCKFTISVKELTVMEVIEILPLTVSAADNIENVYVWKI